MVSMTPQGDLGSATFRQCYRKKRPTAKQRNIESTHQEMIRAFREEKESLPTRKKKILTLRKELLQEQEKEVKERNAKSLTSQCHRSSVGDPPTTAAKFDGNQREGSHRETEQQGLQGHQAHCRAQPQ